jgi:hypothetical protein
VTGVDAAALLVARSELRRRWRSFALLGLLVGAVAALAMAGLTGARRSATAFDRYEAVSPNWDLAIVPNDPGFVEADRRAIARLDGVRYAAAFAVAPLVGAIDGVEHEELFTWLPPVPEDYGERTAPERWAIVEGRLYDLAAPDEALIGRDVARDHGLGIGDRFELVAYPDVFTQQADDDGGAPPLRYPMEVVGIFHEGDAPGLVQFSPGFMATHGDEFAVLAVNQAVWIEPGTTPEALQRAAAAATGREFLPVIDLLKFKVDTRRITGLEAAGLALFALAVLLGGGALVGQALVRAVAAGAADSATLAAIGLPAWDRHLAVAMPAAVTAGVAAVAGPVGAVALSPLFPIGLSRTFELDPGRVVDWPVLVLGTLGTVATVALTALTVAWWTGTVRAPAARRPALAGAALRARLPVPVAIGARLALDPGRGQRAVPLRSAAIGAVVGVLGVVGSLTFRAGINDTVANPDRAGVQADAVLQGDYGEALAAEALSAVRDDPAVRDAVLATWWRNLPVGSGISVWTYQTLVGDLPVTVLRGRTPVTSDEIALAPRLLAGLGTDVGERIPAGEDGSLLVVGEVLVPDNSHQGYDGSGFMTVAGAARLAPPGGGVVGRDREEAVLVTWRQGAAVEEAVQRLGDAGLTAVPPGQPATLTSLRNLLAIPLWLGCFLGLLAAATVAHAVTTTVRRRRHDLAVLASLGLSPRQARASIAVQATLLALVGLAAGVPLGVAAGRVLWRSVNESFSFLYVAPLAVTAVLVVWPVAVAVANLLAAAPARRAAAIRPAVVLRAE